MSGHFDPNMMRLEDLAHATEELHLIDLPTAPLLPIDVLTRALDLIVEANIGTGREVDRRSLAWGICIGIMAERSRKARQTSE